jgi:hypothetical protein
MSGKFLTEATLKAKELAEICDITDSGEINKLKCEKLKELMKVEGRELVDSLNVVGHDIEKAVLDGLLEGINTSHRYLQGEFWGLMLKLIKAYGDSKFHDARNKWAVDMCRRMAKAGEDPRIEEVLDEHIKSNSYR